MTVKKIFPPTYLLISMVVMVAVGLLFPIVWVIPPYWNLLGLLPLAIGIWLNLSADGVFHRAHTTVEPFAQSSILVTQGVFKISPNPMYLGFALLLMGIAILLRSLFPYLVVIVFVVLIDQQFIRVEEKMLAETFGDQYEIYCKTTRRWF